MLRALLEVVDKAGKNTSDASKQAILDLVDDESSDRDGKFTLHHLLYDGKTDTL